MRSSRVDLSPDLTASIRRFVRGLGCDVRVDQSTGRLDIIGPNGRMVMRDVDPRSFAELNGLISNAPSSTAAQVAALTKRYG